MIIYWKPKCLSRADRTFSDRDLFLNTDELDPATKIAVELAVEEGSFSMAAAYCLAADRPRCVFAFRGYTEVANLAKCAQSIESPWTGTSLRGGDAILRTRSSSAVPDWPNALFDRASVLDEAGLANGGTSGGWSKAASFR